MASTQFDLKAYLPLIASGKVRELYELPNDRLLFVATDRISAFDVILSTPIPDKGRLLNRLSEYWFQLLSSSIPELKHHFLTRELPDQIPVELRPHFQDRCMQVRRLKVLPIEAIVRGYITGSAWSEYKRSGTVHGMSMPAGLQESQEFPQGPIYTPSTKAEQGQHDENISPEQAAKIIGSESVAAKVQELAIKIYTTARDAARKKGILIADTKFEFGLDEATGDIVLIDEVLTPDSSRFWPGDSYQVGSTPASFDKQFLRDWLIKEGLKGKDGVEIPESIARATSGKYKEAYEKLTGEKFAIS